MLQEEIRSKFARLAEHERVFRAAEREVYEFLLDLHRSGMTWAQIAEAAGLSSASQARVRVERVMPPEELSPSRRRKTGAPASPVQESPGISVAEAARRLKVAASTIYARIDRGQLKATKDALGRTRVVLDD